MSEVKPLEKLFDSTKTGDVLSLMDEADRNFSLVLKPTGKWDILIETLDFDEVLEEFVSHIEAVWFNVTVTLANNEEYLVWNGGSIYPTGIGYIVSPE